jgi:hypothetical protein
MRIFFNRPERPAEKERLSLWVDRSLKDRLRLIAQQEDLSINHVSRIFMQLMVDEYAKMIKDDHENYEDSATPWLYD